MATTKKPRQASLFEEPKGAKTSKLTPRDLARIILDKGETRYTGAGSLMTRWAMAVLK